MSATAQKIDTVSSQQTKILVKNMMRISISSICYHRDCFPPECFSFRNYGNMKVIQLDAAEMDANDNLVVRDEKAFLLTQWLEKGVFKALEDGLLTALSFAIYTEHPVTKQDLLLETYEFRFNFSPTQASINGVVISSKEDIKSQAAKFVRNLISFTQTLDDLPQRNWITMQMRYKDEAPADYAPEYFTATSESSLVFPDVSASCLRVKLGSIETAQMRTDAKFVGLESLLFDDLCKIQIPDKNNESGRNVDSFTSKRVDELAVSMQSMCTDSKLLVASTFDGDVDEELGGEGGGGEAMEDDAAAKKGKGKGRGRKKGDSILKPTAMEVAEESTDEETETQTQATMQSNAKAKKSVGRKGASVTLEEIDSDEDQTSIKQFLASSISNRGTVSDIVHGTSIAKDRVETILKSLVVSKQVEKKGRFHVYIAKASIVAAADDKKLAATPDAAAPTVVPPKLTKRKSGADHLAVAGQTEMETDVKQKKARSSSSTVLGGQVAEDIENSFESPMGHVEPVRPGLGASLPSHAANSSSNSNTQAVTFAKVGKGKIHPSQIQGSVPGKKQAGSIFPELSNISSSKAASSTSSKAASSVSINKSKEVERDKENDNPNITAKSAPATSIGRSNQASSNSAGWHSTVDSHASSDENPRLDKQRQGASHDAGAMDASMDDICDSQVSECERQGRVSRYGRVAKPIEILRTWPKG